MKASILFILLSGCASVSYQKVNPDGSMEKLTINSLFRSLEGLEAERGEFKIKVNKAKPTVDAEQLAELLRQVRFW